MSQIRTLQYSVTMHSPDLNTALLGSQSSTIDLQILTSNGYKDIERG